ncbi:MAG: sensor histidine kinase [Spirosoma sp.]|nr:sensor histidine kinase [Spirosoma sp.]
MSNYLRGIFQSNLHLSELYEKQNDKEALRYFKIAVAAKDSLNSQDKIKRLLSITFEEREQTRQRAVEKANYQTKIRFVVLVVFLSVFVAIAFILFRNNRQKQKANTVLQGKNEEIEKTVAQLKTAQVTLAAKNAENELLLKEIHHRVKNNLEVVSSLLALQAAQISDPNVQEVMRASQNRVHSMGIIHQKLYQGSNLAVIEMRDYFINLGQSTLDSFGMDNHIQISYPMPELELDMDTAIAVGLITNELLTNALKYAFVDRESGTLTISLTEPDTNNLLLQIGDNGIGKPLGQAATGTGFGTQLVDLLTRQLDGMLTYENQNGTLVKLCFKKPALA